MIEESEKYVKRQGRLASDLILEFGRRGWKKIENPINYSFQAKIRIGNFPSVWGNSNS